MSNQSAKPAYVFVKIEMTTSERYEDVDMSPMQLLTVGAGKILLKLITR